MNLPQKKIFFRQTVTMVRRAQRERRNDETSTYSSIPERRPYNPLPNDPMFSRYKYYSKISRFHMRHQTEENNGGDGNGTRGRSSRQVISLEPPAHVLPPELFYAFGNANVGKAGSLAAIFSIWNTMVGSTFLTIPWGFRQSGIVLGCIIFFLVGIVSYYTCCLVVKHAKNLKELEQIFAQSQIQINDSESHIYSDKKQGIWKGMMRCIFFFWSNSTDSIDETASLLNNENISIISDQEIHEKQSIDREGGKLFNDDFENENQTFTENRESIADFSEVCVLVLGKWSQMLALSASIIILVGATIAYHIFMKDCLSSFVYGMSKLKENHKFPWQNGGPPWYWNDIISSVAIIIIVFPLGMFKDLTFLGKINSFGVFFILGLLAFVIYSCTRALIDPYWTLHQQNTTTVFATINQITSDNSLWKLDSTAVGIWKKIMVETVVLGTSILHGNGSDPHPIHLTNHLQLFSFQFSRLLAILSLSFFIHNVIVSILKNQKTLRNTSRDSGIAYILAGICYLIPGVLGAVAFRFVPDEHVAQNFLNQFSNKDIIANIARIAILLQLMGIFPILLYVIRVQFFGWLLNKQYPGFILTFLLNISVCLTTTAFACFYPKVGTVLSYVGAICGLCYLFVLPIGVHLSVLRKTKQLRWYSLLFHSMLLLFGFAILILQFIPFDKIVSKK